MAVLLLGAAGELGRLVALRLIAQGDEVRAIEPERGAAEAWRALGVHVAVGDPADEDLIYRAAQGVRTIVVLDGIGRRLGEVMAVLVRTAPEVPVGRLVVCAPALPRRVLEVLRASDREYVALATGRRLLRAGAPPELVAEAVDAADDLAGAPRAELDLTEPSALAFLDIRAPG